MAGAASPALLAKLTRPHLRDAVARERLFARLDEGHLAGSAMGVIAPPGAGKTTLVASWLDARHHRGIWYQVDTGDTDLPTFFHYLSLAARAFLPKARLSLPPLRPEYLHDVAGYALRYFRQLFSHLPSGTVIVLDNYQEFDDDHAVHALLAAALADLPRDMTCVLVSRRRPPAPYARAMASEAMRFIEWDDLKLTTNESVAVLRRRWPMDDSLCQALHQRCAGWAAGLTLLAENLRRDASHAMTAPDSSMEDVFMYFASELFSGMTAVEQRVLLQLGYLPRCSEHQAAVLTGGTDAAALLERMYRRQLFVHRRMGEAPTYQLHSLFQSFLQHRVRSVFSSDLQRELARRAGAITEPMDPDAAFGLFLAGEDFNSAARLVLKSASELIAQGRWQVVVDRVDLLLRNSGAPPWDLLYWRGIAQIHVNPQRARQDLQSACEIALRCGHVAGQTMAAAGVIHTYELDYAGFRPMDPWIERLQSLVDSAFDFPDTAGELRALGALVVGMMHRKPDDARLTVYAGRMEVLLDEAQDTNLKVGCATYLLSLGSLVGPLQIARRISGRLLRYLDDDSLSPGMASHAWSRLSWYYCLLHDRENCLAAAQKAISIAQENGLRNGAHTIAANNRAWLEIHAGNVEEVQERLNQLYSLVRPFGAFDRGCAKGVHAWLCVMRGEPMAALEHTQDALTAFDEAGGVFHRTSYRFAAVWANILMREWGAAREWIRQSRQYSDRMHTVWHEVLLCTTEAHIALEAGQVEIARERMTAALRLSRERACDHALGHHLRPWMSRLAGFALENNIETTYLQGLIRRHAWHPPEHRPFQWPWAVRVIALGSFRVEVDGEPLVHSRKAPRKPLALLKFLVSHGGRDVCANRLTDTLWPEDDGDSAYHNLGLNLHRLRKLLGHADAVRLVENRVSLNDELVWTDVAFFSHRIEGSHASDADIDRTLDTYRGPFLGGSDEFPWMRACRERLRDKYARGLCARAEQLAKSGRADEAIATYRRGIEAEPLSEVFYQGLMRQLTGLGQHAAARDSYLRLEAAMASQLGTPPCAGTRAILAEARL